VRIWREQWRLAALGLFYALLYSALSLAIPLLVARAIDGSILGDDRPLAPQLVLIGVLALARSGVNFLRRFATARVGVGVEARMRELLYEAYLRFPRAFYDLHATGQVVSRATNDLYPIRYFIGWGMVQGAQSAMMVVGAGVVLLRGRAVIAGTLTYGEFALFIQLLLQLVWPLESMGWILNLGQRALASAGRSFAWLDQVPCLPEPDEPEALHGKLAVELQGVHFGYPGAEPVLRGVDLRVEPGEVLAVCGATGEGKSTLLGLLPRFYDPTGGAVLLGGIDLRELTLADARRAVGLVTQRPILFSETLRENLLAGRPDADWAEVERACEIAGVTLFLEDLPDGWDTLIGERGVNLSGGQRQRVALARALLSRAPVLVLDDPLSAVDTTTELAVIARLREAVAEKTVLLATQRLSTLALADRVAVLADGVIAESGTPAELLGRGGAFVALFGEDVAVAA
jgi:ABC-type multidrug transport system fused ATPase/permease subunit